MKKYEVLVETRHDGRLCSVDDWIVGGTFTSKPMAELFAQAYQDHNEQYMLDTIIMEREE